MSIISAGGAVVGAGSVAAYQIQRSLRFNSADSAYLNRTPASASNRKTWTWSGWVKRSKFDTDQGLFARSNSGGSSHTGILFDTNNNLRMFSDSGGPYSPLNLITSQVFRDSSAWYHIVVALDTTQATASNRLKFYLNGSQITAFSTANYPSQNDEYQINTTNPHGLGAYYEFASGWYFDGYLTEINFIDGQALTPSDFGETDSATGVWKPKAYSGTYGTNGFYLNFSDNASTTTLGDDLSGNGNDWTTNNFSVTAGAGNDSLVDTPTNYGTDTGVGGEVRGNYCTWNPLRNDQNAVLSNGNLDLSTAGVTARYGTYTTIGVSSAKWYWEITAGSLSTDDYNIGIASASKGETSPLGSDTESYIYISSGDKRTNNTTAAYGATYTAGDVIGVALDLDAGTLTFYKNGASQGTAYSSIPSNIWFPTVADNNTGSTTGSSFIANFGQRAFAYTAPSGFKALCTQNLPTPTIGATSTTQANDYFNAVLYTGNTPSTNAITGVGFAPDFVWVKSRTVAESHNLVDKVRGNNLRLKSNEAVAEASATFTLDSDGFTVGANSESNTGSMVGWAWKANGAGSSNTAGTITSTVSANTTSGFSIATYTGNGPGNVTIGHGLGAVPSMIIVKVRNQTDSWYVYHASVGNTKYLELNATAAATVFSTMWQDTNPTSTVFTTSYLNVNTYTYVAYCFAPVAGYSAFGSYTGNGSADGPFVYLGFRPRYLLIKRTDSATGGNWWILDTSRSTFNLVAKELRADTSTAEDSYNMLDMLSNGFKFRDSDVSWNGSGATYIYAAFAENPFKFSLAR